MFWLAGQGLAPIIAVSSLIVLTFTCVFDYVKIKGDDAMENKKGKIGNFINHILFTMSSNSAVGALLTKAH